MFTIVKFDCIIWPPPWGDLMHKRITTVAGKAGYTYKKTGKAFTKLRNYFTVTNTEYRMLNNR